MSNKKIRIYVHIEEKNAYCVTRSFIVYPVPLQAVFPVLTTHRPFPILTLFRQKTMRCRCAMPIHWSRLMVAFYCSIITLLAVSVMVLIYLSGNWALLLDAPLYHYISWLMTQGAVPYRDIFEANFPGTYLLHLLVIKCFGESDAAWRAFDLSCLGIIGVFSFLYCRRFGLLAACAATVLFAAMHLSGGPLAAGTRDYVLLVFIAPAFYFFSIHSDRPSGFFYVLLTGFLLGLAFTIKPFVVVLAAFFCCLPAVQHSPSGLSRLKKPMILLASFCMPSVLVLLWLWQNGAAGAFADFLFRFLLPIYSGIRFSSLSIELYRPFLGLPLWLLLVAIAVFETMSLAKRGKTNPNRFVLLIGLLYGLFHYLVQQKGLIYHLYPALFFAILITASWLEYLNKRPISVRHLIMACLAGYMLCGLTCQSVKNIFIKPPHFFEKSGYYDLLHNDLNGRVPPYETVQAMEAFGGTIMTLFKMHIRQPTRFIHDAYFYYKTDHPYVQGLRKVFIEELQEGKPLFVVMAKNSWPVGGYDRIKLFPELEKFIQEHYVLDRQREQYRIYKRKEALSTSAFCPLSPAPLPPRGEENGKKDNSER